MYDELWRGGPRMIKGADALPLCTDSVLLSSFTPMSGAARALDLGCGSGAIMLILAWQNPGVSFDGVEILPSAAEAARENAKINGLSDRINVITGDLREYRTEKPYDLVVSNPPYFAVGSGTSSPLATRSSSRDETACTLSDLVKAAARLTKNGVKFVMVYRPERLSEALSELSAAGLEPKRLRLVQVRTGKEPSMALIECRRGGKRGMRVEPVLIMQNEDGSETDEILKIYHRDGENQL